MILVRGYVNEKDLGKVPGVRRYKRKPPIVSGQDLPGTHFLHRFRSGIHSKQIRPKESELMKMVVPLKIDVDNTQHELKRTDGEARNRPATQ